MANQYGATRVYTTADEATSPRKVMCDKCKVYTVPKGLQTNHINPSAKQEKYCPNCGHVHRFGTGRDNH